MSASLASQAPAEPGKAVAVRRRPDAVQVTVVAATIVAFVLRLVQLDDSLFGDELFTYVIASRDGLGDVMAGMRSQLEVTPPLYAILAWLAQQVGGPMVWIRVPALLASTVTVPLVYALGAQAGSRRGGAIAAVAWAIAPFTVFYGVEARGYSLMACLVAASTLTLIRAVRGGRWPWFAYALLTIATIYTHYTSVFAIGAQALWVLGFHRRAVLPLLGNYAVAAVAFAPWLGEVRDDLNAPGSAILGLLNPLSRSVFVDGVGRWLVGTPFLPLDRVPGTGWVLVIAAGFVLAAAGTAAAWHRGGRAGIAVRPEIALLVLVAAAAPVGVLAASLVGDDIFAPRNLTSSLPCVAALVGVLLAAPHRLLATTATVAVLGGLAAGTARQLDRPQRRPDWKGAAAYVDRVAASPNDVVYESPVINLTSPPWRQLSINLRRNHRRLGGLQPISPEAVRAATGSRLVVVTPALGVALPPPAPSGFRLVGSRSFPGLATLLVSVYDPVR